MRCPRQNRRVAARADEQRALRLLEGHSENERVPVPFPVAMRQRTYARPVEPFVEAMKAAEEGTVRLRDLVATQRTVNVGKLRTFIGRPDIVPEGKQGAIGQKVDLPIVVKYGGESYVHDGHHRLTAQKLRGKDTARAYVVDLDREGWPLKHWAGSRAA